MPTVSSRRDWLFRARDIISPPMLQTATAIADPIVSISGLTKVYASGHQALKSADLEIRRGEILALLGPNGAGKTTLTNIICAILRPSEGTDLADVDHDNT